MFMISYLLIEHDLFGKPVSTFSDHALAIGNAMMKTQALLAAAAALLVGHATQAAPLESTSATTTYHRATVDGVGGFYREAGPKDAATRRRVDGVPASA